MIFFLCEWIWEFTYCNKLNEDLLKTIETESIDDLRLTIYCLPPSVLTTIPMETAERLIKAEEENKIVVNGNDLEEYVDELKGIGKERIIPLIKKTPFCDIRTYYILESKKNGKLIDVAMGGIDGEYLSIFFNGVEIKANSVFYDLIIPFVSGDIVKSLTLEKEHIEIQNFMSRGWRYYIQPEFYLYRYQKIKSHLSQEDKGTVQRQGDGSLV